MNSFLLPFAETQIFVGFRRAALTVGLHATGSTDGVHGFRDGDGFLRNVNGVHDVVARFDDRIFPQADLVHITARIAQVTGISEEGSIALEAFIDLDDTDAVMRFEGLECHFLGDFLLAMGDNGDDVAMGDRGMDEDAGRIDMRHDGHQVDSLVAGSLVHLQGIGQATMIVTRISHAADDRDGNAIDAIGAVEAVNRADQAGGVAGGQLQVVCADTLFEVVEYDIDTATIVAKRVSDGKVCNVSVSYDAVNRGRKSERSATTASWFGNLIDARMASIIEVGNKFLIFLRS